MDLAKLISEYVKSEIMLNNEVRAVGSYPGDVQKHRIAAFTRIRNTDLEKMTIALSRIEK